MDDLGDLLESGTDAVSDLLDGDAGAAGEEKDFEDYLEYVCGASGGIVGALIPSGVYAALGLETVGPVAGGVFAGTQAAGSVTAGSIWASLQSYAMTGSVVPLFVSAAAIGGTGYFICDKYGHKTGEGVEDADVATP